MTTQTQSCPYCNASISVSPGVSDGQRITCPRCGDAFPLRLVDSFTPHSDAHRSSDPAIAANAMPDTRIYSATNLTLPSRRSNRLIAGAVIAVMLFMAGSGLLFMLMTQEQRRGYDTSRPPRRPGKQRGVPETELSPALASVAPDKLAALGYLPADVNVLFAARVPELLANPIGAKLAQDPITLERSGHRLKELPAWLGFRLEEIDHLVFAARIDDALIPPSYVVFRTVQPYVEEQLRLRLKATRVARPSKKTIYTFHPRRPDVPLYAWFADEQTVVLAMFADQLERLPAQPSENLQQLSEEIRSVLKQKREPFAPLWVVGHSRDWSKTSAAKFLGGLKKETWEKLASLTTFGIWFVPNEVLTIKGVFACPDEQKARDLENYFRMLRGPDANFTTALDGFWLLLQWQTEPDFLSRWLKP